MRLLRPVFACVAVLMKVLKDQTGLDGWAQRSCILGCPGGPALPTVSSARLLGYRRMLGVLIVATTGIATSARAESFDDAGRAAHAMLTELCDDFGGRVTGSPMNRAALEKVAVELRALGLQPEIEAFKMPGWERGDDRVDLVQPFARPLRVAALAYVQPHDAFEADVVAVGTGAEKEYPENARGKIALVAQGTALPVREFTRIALAQGIRGILFINREGGGQLLARTGSFVGENLPLPVYSLTQEAGLSMQRLLARGQSVRVRMETKSRSEEVTTANLRVVIAGRSPERIIVGAHFDSWDLGQGALDNGLGVAQLFALARALRDRPLARTIELHWYNGEEQGLWGSRHAAAAIGDTPIVVMINLDMVGVPIAVNALGDTTLVAALERWNASRAARKLPKGVDNINWLGSDHTPYQLAGVRTLTFNAPIPRESVRYYHDWADTIDKLPAQIVADSTTTIGELVLALAEDSSLGAFRRTPEDTVKIFSTFGLEARLRAMGLWSLLPAVPGNATPAVVPAPN